MAWGGGPVAMGCLVLAHEHERLVLFALVLEPFESEVGDDVGAVALVTFTSAGLLDEVGVVVASLAGEDFPVVESGGVTDEVPFADHGGLVTGLLDQLGEGGLAAVEARVVIVEEPVGVGMEAGEDSGAGGAANGIGAE